MFSLISIKVFSFSTLFTVLKYTPFLNGVRECYIHWVGENSFKVFFFSTLFLVLEHAVLERCSRILYILLGNNYLKKKSVSYYYIIAFEGIGTMMNRDVIKLKC